METGIKLDKYEKLADSARLLRSKPIRSVSGRWTAATVNPSGYLIPIPIDGTSLQGDISLVNGNKIVAPEDGVYNVSVSRIDFTNTGSSSTTVLVYILHRKADGTIIAQDLSYVAGAFPWGKGGDLTAQMKAGEYFDFELRSDGGRVLSIGSGYVSFTFSQLEKAVPDVYAEKFADMVPDYKTFTAMANGTGNTIAFTAPESAYYRLNTITVAGSVGAGMRLAIRVTPYNGGGTFDHSVNNTSIFTGQTTAYTSNMLFLHAGDTLGIAQAGLDIATWTIAKISSAPISIVKPTVQALPGGIDFIAETQVGWYEVAPGVFKAKYSRRFPFTSIALGTTGVNATLGTIAGGFKLLDAWGDYTVDGTPSIGSLLPINRYNNPALTQQVVIGIDRSSNTIILVNLLSIGLTGQAISGEVSAVYTKTADPTYTLDDILALNPPTP